MTKRYKITIIGGGSSYTPEIIEGFINRAYELPIDHIYLVDIEEGLEKLKIVENLAKRMVKKSGVNINIKSTLNRKEALSDSDFVVTQFRVGGLNARIKDEQIPLKYGVIGQETTGPGGFAKALRTIPVILDICKEMEELCPDAFLINFTNPSGIITETISKHTNIKVIGLCNESVTNTNKLANYLNVDPNRIYIDFVGLNHLVWGQRIYLDGKDITKDIFNREDINELMKNISSVDFDWNKDFIRSLNMLVCNYQKYYYFTDEMKSIEKKNAETIGTRGEVVRNVEKELFDLYSDEELDIKPPQLAQRGGAFYSDAACNLISSIVNDKKDIQIVDVRNNSTILDLPEDVVIETNCIIGKNGAKPISIGHIPPRTRGLIQVVKAYEELTVEAGVKGDYRAGLQALTIHPLVPSSNIAKNLLDDIISAHKDYLPQFK